MLSARMNAVQACDVTPRAQHALKDSPIFALRDVAVSQDGDTLVLTGRVRSFYHKQLAQEVVRTVAEGLEVINGIAVHEETAVRNQMLNLGPRAIG